jgi:hypothetical protein
LHFFYKTFKPQLYWFDLVMILRRLLVKKILFF